MEDQEKIDRVVGAALNLVQDFRNNLPEIKDAESLELACTLYAKIKGALDTLDAEQKSMTSPLHKVLMKIASAFSNAKSVAEDLKIDLASRILNFRSTENDRISAALEEARAQLSDGRFPIATLNLVSNVSSVGSCQFRKKVVWYIEDASQLPKDAWVTSINEKWIDGQISSGIMVKGVKVAVKETIAVVKNK